jgi:hypothetical protein
MAIQIRDFNFIPTQDDNMNQALTELQMTLADFKSVLIQFDKRLEALEEV